MLINFAKKLFDVFLYMRKLCLRLLMGAKALLYSSSKISRSFWESRSPTNWDLKTRYPELYNSQALALISFFNQQFGNRKINILDLGCADGRSSIFLVKDFILYGLGFDISPDFIASAASYAQNHDVNADFFMWDAYKEDLNITQFFDVIMALGLFTCITKNSVFKSILDSISNHVQSGGYFIVKDTLSENMDAQKVSKNFLYAANYRFIEDYIGSICARGFEKIEQKKLYQFPDEPYASYFLIFRKK